MQVTHISASSTLIDAVNPSGTRKRKVSHIVYLRTLLTMYRVRAVIKNAKCTENSGSDLAANHEIAIITELPQSEDKEFEQLE